MKLKNIKIFTWMTLSLLMVATSCRDDTFADYWEDNSDEYTVTINVGLEGMSTSTRDGDEISSASTQTPLRYIGDGSKIDMLVYAVYYDANQPTEEDKQKPNYKPNWQAAPEYAKGTDPIKEDYKYGKTKEDITFGYGQTVLNVSSTLQKGNQAKQPITLTLKKNQAYKVVFWAQNHNTEAFVIDDLKRVQMKYKVLHDDNEGNDHILSINNDEYRDAFCRSIDLDGNQSNRDITIYLRRPVAQINIGTRGFDYESITRNTTDGEEYLYSKIRINRAARYLNVVTDEVYTTTTNEEDTSAEDTEAFYTIDYEYNKFPAYWRMGAGEDGGEEMTPFPSYTVYDADNSTVFNAFKENHADFFNGKNAGESEEDYFKRIYGKEEFLKVHLFEHSQDEINQYGKEGEDGKKIDDFYLPYASMGLSLTNSKEEEEKNNRSEEFKYLSMCYILTNSDDTKQQVLTNVKAWVAKDKDGKDEVEIVNLNNVPVQRNHRTNIVGSLLTAKANMIVMVDQDFAGRKIHGESEVQSGEITEGFYYDADKNEFQISSLNGLLFFQQLVNGDLTVRQVSNNNPYKGTVGSPYPYYDPNSHSSNPPTLYLKYKSWTKDELKERADIILYGSGYDDLAAGKVKPTVSGKQWTFKVEKGSDNWPKYNNFPFYGATVKLMADIDLAGIEWIPIGFDCANWDTTFGNYTTGYKKYYKDSNNVTINYIALTTPEDGKNEVVLGNRRAFCGTFDGNGHTIYNLSTKKFGGNVHMMALQDYGTSTDTGNKGGPYDNVQWFQKGFFGVCGPGAVIKDLRLQNVDIQGNNGVGAVVGQVSSLGFPAKIINCIVDGGVIDAVPIYRGDYNTVNVNGRTSARGCYIGGIVGQFCAKDDVNKNDESGISEIKGCEVRNLVIQGYRRVGGIVGSIADQGSAGMANSDIQLDIRIEGNSVANSMILVNQYRAFNLFWDFMGNGTNNTNVWMNGFGWGSGASYTPMANNIVGGYYHTDVEITLAGDDVDAFKYAGNYTKKSYKDKNSYYAYVNSNNTVSNLQYTELAVSPDNTNNLSIDNGRTAEYRESIIQNVPMNYIPVFTSIFIDKATLKNNYYGETKLHTKLNFYDAPLWVNYDGQYNGKKNTFSIPINFPNKYDIEPIETSPFTGIYVESVDLNGSEAPGGRSVITPNGVDGTGSCVLYVTARDRKQFVNNNKPSISGSKYNPASYGDIGNKYKQPTNISNVVLRGSPYAWAGIIFAPNENMSEVNLTNVTIYDVYRTLSLETDVDQAKEDKEPYPVLQNYTDWKDASVKLKVNNCNLRGYTSPGGRWNEINYEGTTFEQGTETRYSYDAMKNADGSISPNRNEYKTCDVEANTTFTDCYFKAPYYINLRPFRTNNSDGTLAFTSCKGASAYDNVEIKLPDGKESLVYFIGIEKNTEKGCTVITYYGENQDIISQQVGNQ